jgi:hypothetical protein
MWNWPYTMYVNDGFISATQRLSTVTLSKYTLFIYILFIVTNQIGTVCNILRKTTSKCIFYICYMYACSDLKLMSRGMSECKTDSKIPLENSKIKSQSRIIQDYFFPTASCDTFATLNLWDLVNFFLFFQSSNFLDFFENLS